VESFRFVYGTLRFRWTHFGKRWSKKHISNMVYFAATFLCFSNASSERIR